MKFWFDTRVLSENYTGVLYKNSQVCLHFSLSLKRIEWIIENEKHIKFSFRLPDQKKNWTIKFWERKEESEEKQQKWFQSESSLGYFMILIKLDREKKDIVVFY